MDNASEKVYFFISEIKKELKTKNRFSCDPRFDSLIKQFVDEPLNSCILDSKDKLYRARIYTQSDAEQRFKTKSKKRFQGYNAEQSFVNRNNSQVGEGRCNPSYIPYLYTATSEKCCIYEVRPHKNSFVSIAKIKIDKELKILKFDSRFFLSDSNPMIIEGVLPSRLFLSLALEFSSPYKEYGDYLFCQYVSEKIKNLGFDGISYLSSVYDGTQNRNVVIFNYNKCHVTSSKLIKINEIEIKYN